MNMDKDSLPVLDGHYPLSADLIAKYRRDGHVLLRAVATKEEVAAYRPIFLDAVRRLNRQQLPLEERDTYHKAFLQIGNLWEVDELARRFVMSRRFARIAAELMGVNAVRIYHDQALYKEPGGGFTPWHQDMYYWPLDTENTITMWMPLVPCPRQMGSMIFASGSHRAGQFKPMHISDESEAYFEQITRDYQFPLEQYDLDAGDATFHAGWTLHRATANTTGEMREVMTIIYMADGVRVLEPDNPNRPMDLARWLPGCRPGDIAASPLNPLVYSSSMETPAC